MFAEIRVSAIDQIECDAQNRTVVHGYVPVSADWPAPFEKSCPVSQIKQLEQLQIMHASTASPEHINGCLGDFCLIESKPHVDYLTSFSKEFT